MIDDLHMLDLAQGAYIDLPDITAGDAFFTLRLIEGLLVASGRGTDPRRLRDLLTDADAVYIEHPVLGPTHAGFARDAEGVLAQLLAQAGTRPIAFNGHSKGGSDAEDLAALYKHAGGQVVQVTTFGAARVGWLNGALYNVPGSDWWNADDPIPSVPPWISFPRDRIRIGTPRWKLDVLDDHALTAYRQSLIAHLAPTPPVPAAA